MRNQPRIIMMNPPSNIPSYMVDFDGFYSLDLSEKERIALTKKIDEYINVGEIKQDTFKEIAIPVTNKNRILFGSVGNPNALNQKSNTVFDIQLLCGDYSYPVSGLQIVGFSDRENVWQCVVFGDTAGWVRYLSTLYLNTIDLGSEVCDETFVKTTLPLNHAYTDGGYPIFAPLVNYGEWFTNHNIADFSAQSQVVFNNYRYWYSASALMRQVFCMAGYELIAPILETDYYRRVWLYLLDPDFETANQADIANRPFEATRSSNISLASSSNIEPLSFLPTLVNDPGGHTISVFTGTVPYYGFFYSGGVIGDFRTTGTVSFTNPLAQILLPTAPENLTIKVSICKSDRYGHDDQQSLIDYSTTLTYKEFIRTTPIGPGIVVNFDFDLSTGNVKVYQHEVVFVRIEVYAYLVESGTGVVHGEALVRNNSDLLSGATFYLIPFKQVIEKGDTLEFGAMLRKDKTALELVKGIVHLHNLKIQTDTINKKVYMYPEFRMELLPDGVQEGYFKENQNNPLEVTDKIQVKSLDQGFINTSLSRYAYLKFLDSSDGYIQRLNLLRELHSKYYDFGSEYTDGEPNKIENPFFEPTEIGEDGRIGINDTANTPTYEIKTVNIIPFLWESNPGNASEYSPRGYDFTPRIAIAYELSLDIRTYRGITVALNGFVYEDTFWYPKNCFGQIYPALPEQVQYFTPAAPATPVVPDIAIVYGRGEFKIAAPDLWEMIYRRSIAQAYYNIAIKLMAKIDLTTFSNLSFRQKWHLVYNTAAWGEINIYCRLSYILDYVIGDDISTPIELIPDNNNFDLCE